MPTTLRPSSLPVGILGGGQLARMLALRAHAMGLPVAVLSESPDDPAAQVVRHWVQGSLGDRETLKAFLERCSIVTFESEFLNAEVLAALSKETGRTIYPRPRDMGLIQDRLTQKALLVKNSLPTAESARVDSPADAREAFAAWGAVVYKKRRFGYDGYGTFVVRDEKALEKFCAEFESIPGRAEGFLAEKFVPFKRELAVMIARGLKGKTIRLPFVETHQENSRCLWVKGPLPDTDRLKKLGKQLDAFLEAIRYVGVMGVELFDTGRDLLVNELAPRVHNSGHYSLEALSEDQFTLHLKAITGSELAAPQLRAKGFAMYNLLGASGRQPSWVLTPDVFLHWYGKAENRAGRKMGHVNVLGRTPEESLRRARTAVGENFRL